MAVARPQAASSVPKAAVSPWLIAPVVALAAFMEVLDISIANVSLQHIAGNLGASQDESTWVLTSYLVTNAIVLPISGWLSGVMGRKRFFMTCIIGFSITSMLCGMAPTLTTLIVFRALQGLTGGGLQPSSQAILSDAFPPAKRGMAFALYGIAVVFAPAIGPTLGGWITDNFSWRWVFLINVPIGFILFTLVEALVNDPEHLIKAREQRRRAGISIDYIGFSLLALGLGLMQYVLDRGQQDDWFNSTLITSLTLVSVSAVVLFVFWELRQDDPIVDLRLLADRNFAVANLLMFLLGFILLASTALLPIYVQSLLGYTSLDAGLVISPGGFAIMLMMPIVGRLVTRVDVRALIATGLVITGTALLYMAHFNTLIDYDTVALARIWQALGLAFLFIPINTAAYLNVPMAKSSNASALINLARNVGGSVGISLTTTLLAQRSQFHQSVLVDRTSHFNPIYQDHLHTLAAAFAARGASAGHALMQAQDALYHTIQQQASMLAFIDDFRVLGLLFLGLIPFVMLLQRVRPGGVAAAAH